MFLYFFSFLLHQEQQSSARQHVSPVVFHRSLLHLYLRAVIGSGKPLNVLNSIVSSPSFSHRSPDVLPWVPQMASRQ